VKGPVPAVTPFAVARALIPSLPVKGFPLTVDGFWLVIGFFSIRLSREKKPESASEPSTILHRRTQGATLPPPSQLRRDSRRCAAARASAMGALKNERPRPICPPLLAARRQAQACVPCLEAEPKGAEDR
jgi:hypothetical protein